MTGFANQVIGGISKLVRAAIQSPNYAPGLTGWTINKDGSAEFSNATLRGSFVITSSANAILIYNGAPAAGNLLMAIALAAGSDAFGNHWFSGATFNQDVTAGGGSNNGYTFQHSPLDNLVAAALFMDAVGGQGLKIASNEGIVMLASNAISLQNSGGHNIALNAAGLLALNGAGGVQLLGGDITLASGKPGKYCSGNWTYSTSRTTSSVTALSALTQTRLNSDYGSPIVSGTFHPPVDGFYDMSLFMNAAIGATREACIILVNGTEIAHNESPNSTNLVTTVTNAYLLATDVVTFVPFYSSATTPQTVTGNVFIGRRL